MCCAIWARSGLDDAVKTLPLFLILLTLGVGAFFVLAVVLRWELVDGWRKRLWGEWSTKLQMGGLLSLISLLPVDPVTGLSLYNMMPHEVRSILPARVLYPVAIVLFVLSWLAKYAKQRSLDVAIKKEKIEEAGAKAAVEVKEAAVVEAAKAAVADAKIDAKIEAKQEQANAAQ